MPDFKSRQPPRDTMAYLQIVEATFASEIEKTKTEIGNVRKDLGLVQLTAEKALQEAAPKRVSWGKVVSIALPIIVLAGTVTVNMDRKLDREDFSKEMQEFRREVQNEIKDIKNTVNETRTAAEMLREVVLTIRAALLEKR